MDVNVCYNNVVSAIFVLIMSRNQKLKERKKYLQELWGGWNLRCRLDRWEGESSERWVSVWWSGKGHSDWWLYPHCRRHPEPLPELLYEGNLVEGQIEQTMQKGRGGKDGHGKTYLSIIQELRFEKLRSLHPALWKNPGSSRGRGCSLIKSIDMMNLSSYHWRIHLFLICYKTEFGR